MYEVVGRYNRNYEVVGFCVKDEQGNIHQHSKEHIIKLAKQGCISNIKVESINGKDYLIGIGKQISKLPVLDTKTNKPIEEQLESSSETIKAIGKIIEDGELTGLVVQSSDGEKTYRISKKKAWELANRHILSNVKAQISNGVKVITGDGYKISELPIMH